MASLFSGVGVVIASDLPDCPSSGYFHNCFGTWYDGKGYKYVGAWKNHRQHGQGTATWSAPNTDAGYKYVGEHKDGKRNGQGTSTWSAPHKSAGEKYVGMFKDDNNHGQGTYTFANGDKYVGEYKDGKRNGQGTYTFADGEKYVGEWKDDKQHGKGTYTFTDGTVEEGIWKDGEFQYAQKLPANSSSSGNSKLDNHKEFCEGIGFTPGTEKFGDCVVKMMDKD